MFYRLSDFIVHNKKYIKGVMIGILGYLLLPYIEIIMKSIYTIGTIVGTYTRLYSWKS